MKICAKCGLEKDCSEFYKNNAICKKCRIKYVIEWRNNNLERRKKYEKQYWIKEKLKISAYFNEYRKLNKSKVDKKYKEYALNHKEEIREYKKSYDKRRRAVDPNFKLRTTLRKRLYNALKHSSKLGSAIADLGCSIEELRVYLESKFQPGMTWDNHSHNGWHIDHIIPLDYFDLTDREQLLKACHYTNLQPLWAKDNLRKGNR